MKIVTIKGDGIGPSIMDSVKKILMSLNSNFEFIDALAGKESLAQKGSLLPDETLSLIKEHKLCLKSPLETPIGNGFSSINVALRKKLDLYANVRPIKNKDLDFVIIRENTEGMYGGEQIGDDLLGEAKSRITRAGAERIINYAISYAIKNKRKKITLVHKANILKTTSGLMLKVFKEKQKDYPNIEFEDLIVDNTAMQMVLNPHRFDVIVTSNLFGDILSDLGAGLIGGLGLAPGVNRGDDVSIYEAVHGTAPDIVGKNLANPLALLKSAGLLLEERGLIKEKQILDKSIDSMFNEKKLTKDLGGGLGTIEFTNELIQKIKNYSS